MGKSYQRKTNRSRKKLQKLDGQAITVKLADGKAVSSKRLRQLLERPLHDLELCVILIDGEEFHDFTLITALGIDIGGRKHILALWPGATENSEVCGQLLDELVERGLSRRQRYLFILDGSKALAKAVKNRFGRQVLI